MQISKLAKVNEDTLEQYKKLGFKSKTHMIDYALTELRKRIKKAKRQQWLKEALTEYASAKNENYFQSIESDPFE